MRRAVYAGSFDPLTNGHLWMIERGVSLFDEMIVAIGENPDKRYTFSTAERVELLRDGLQHLPKVRIEVFENRYLVDFARERQAHYILRGIREAADYEYERKMRYVNADLAPHIDTVFLMPPRSIAEISSTMVKGLVGPLGWEQVVAHYVPPPVLQHLVRWQAAGGK
ncbi:pantetheine-phosphate adenylyltransferase [Chitinilyticum aquatile]|uniref:pantetheine-phosphate adenylyltransferase n=1 Tax=Chitinilyticum aquatile TaxID=362520 RepID=UPI0004258DDB|nr:pantetheine-phosphate adenylyltransferase [Chitinilyticum aquatile]